MENFVETGSYKGVGAKFWSKHFNVVTCEVDRKFYDIAMNRLYGTGALIFNTESSSFLKTPIITPQKFLHDHI